MLHVLSFDLSYHVLVMRVLVAAAKSNINATGFADKKSFVAKGIICPFSIIGVEQVRHAQKPLPNIGKCKIGSQIY